jgi:hypothetical protein
VDAAAVTIGWTSRFLGATVMAGRHGPNGDDGRVDGAVLERDGDNGGGGRGGGRMVPGAAMKAEEE